jgi:hypothetical protein
MVETMDDYTRRLIKSIKNKEGEAITPEVIQSIYEQFGYPFFIKMGPTNLAITNKGKNHIYAMFKQEQNMYNTVVQLLKTHLNWLSVYCHDTFNADTNKRLPNNKTQPSFTKETIRKYIKDYMTLNYKFTNECNDENLGIRDLISYDDTENMSEKLQAVYMFMSLFRITQSGKPRVDHKKNYCILLNEFINNLTSLLIANNNTILTKTTKFMLFSREVVIKEEDFGSLSQNIKSPNIQHYGNFILVNIINKLFN